MTLDVATCRGIATQGDPPISKTSWFLRTICKTCSFLRTAVSRVLKVSLLQGLSSFEVDKSFCPNLDGQCIALGSLACGSVP